VLARRFAYRCSRRVFVRHLAVLGAYATGLSLSPACDALSGLTSPRRTARIGYLSASTEVVNKRNFDPFREALRELGWGEGDNLEIVQRYAGGETERLPALVAELLAARLDLLVGAGADAAQALTAASHMPIVFLNSQDPVGDGLVASLARPGGNVTGTAAGVSTDLSSKRLELLSELVPQLRHLGYVTNLSITTLRQRRNQPPARAGRRVDQPAARCTRGGRRGRRCGGEAGDR
jgi:hypothetical protein